MKTWKLTLEYDGTRYSGWQEQKNARTITGEIRAAAEDYLGVEIELGGAGRTDAGVHAAAQVAHLRVNLRRVPQPHELVRELNRRLPADIAVLDAELMPNSFHARHDATGRSYVYQIATRKSAFSKRYVWWVKERLDVELMSECARLIPGRHDFVCFAAPDPSRPDESTIVVVESASVERDGDLVLFRIEASHFLWRMVRRLAGMLVRVGTGDITRAQYEQLLEGRCEKKRIYVEGSTAPASGLFLDAVKYE
jgi:tRNA pseudouridine38-40 synthase